MLDKRIANEIMTMAIFSTAKNKHNLISSQREMIEIPALKK